MKKIDKRELEQRMNLFETVFRGEGVKITQQRLEVFREVAQAGDHPDAEQVFQRVRKRIPTISLDTVYRTLWQLNDLNLVTTLSKSRERTRFDANMKKHHHFVCDQCGFTGDFYSSGFDEVKLPESIEELGKVLSTHIEVHGICRECQKEDKS